MFDNVKVIDVHSLKPLGGVRMCLGLQGLLDRELVSEKIRDALLEGVQDLGVPRVGGEGPIDPEEACDLVHRQLR